MFQCRWRIVTAWKIFSSIFGITVISKWVKSFEGFFAIFNYRMSFILITTIPVLWKLSEMSWIINCMTSPFVLLQKFAKSIKCYITENFTVKKKYIRKKKKTKNTFVYTNNENNCFFFFSFTSSKFIFHFLILRNEIKSDKNFQFFQL